MSLVSLCVCSTLRIFIHSRGLDRGPESGVEIHRKVQATVSDKEADKVRD